MKKNCALFLVPLICGPLKFFWLCGILLFLRSVLTKQVPPEKGKGEKPSILNQKTQIRYAGRNMYKLEKACILPKRRGIMVLQEFESDVESVYACNGLFYQNEYGIRKLNVFRFNSLEVSDIHWLSSPAHVILPSSTVSFWHFLQSLVPAFEFVMKDTMAPEQTTFYFLENNLQVKSDSCLLRQNSPIIATKLSNFKHNYSTDGIYELFTSPFESNVNVEQLETMQCHEEVIIGTPLVLHHSAHEWVQILKKKEKKIERDTLNYFGKDFY